MNQKLAMKVLERHGDAVEIAENGALAVDAFKQRVAQGRVFDIILVRCCFAVLGAGWGVDCVGGRCVDGRVDAVHGRDGGDGAHKGV